MTDMVNSPKHYQTESGLEAIDVIEAFFNNSFHLGNAFKYLARAGKKGNYAEDLRKSIWYISRELDRTYGQSLDKAAKETATMPTIPHSDFNPMEEN